jgi:choice-of-anchor C domain-containing protein
MTLSLLAIIPAVDDVLFYFAQSDGFWANFAIAFGTSYDVVKATQLRQQWQSRNFSQLPPIEVLSDEVLGTANGAYSSSTNKIYLSASFLNTASSAAIVNVILEEIGHYVDAQINQVDSAGDEGAIFAKLVQGNSLDVATLDALRAENDQTTIIVNGEVITVEQNKLLKSGKIIVANDGQGLYTIYDPNFQVNLITNGSFEIGPDPDPYLPLDPGSTAITGWTVTRDQIDYVAYWVDADGERSLDLNGSPGVGGIAQTFSTIAGQQYLVSFALAGNTYSGTPIRQLGVSAAGQSEVFSFDTTGFSDDNMGWVNKTWVFTATASTTTLEFYSLSIEPENAAFGPALDNVSVISLLPSITLAAAPASVTEDGTPNLVYTFTRTTPTTSALTVNYTVGGTATFSTDYTQSGAASFTSTTGTVTFAAGSSTATVTVNPTADTTVESDETVILTLASGTGYTVGTTTPVTGTITNDDTSVTLAVSPASVTEDGTTNLVYTFTRSGVTTNPLTVNYTLGGTATLNTDYTRTGTNNTVTFVAGSSTATVTVDPTADTIVESNETVILTLAAGTGYTVGTPNAATGTITNDDTSVTLAVSPASVTEDGTTNLVYTFTRSGVTTNPLTVNYTLGGTATLNTDYTRTGTTNTVTFAAGSSTATVTVDPTADTIVESNETVILTLAAGTGYTIGTTTPVTGTINNDDTTVTSQLSINDITVVEGKDNNAILTVIVDNPNSQPITFNYTTAPINATANVDYTSKTGTITIAPNTATATISIPILNDNLNEPDEAFTVTLSNPVNATINPEGGIGEVIITDTWQSTLTRTLPNNVENLRLIGSNNINGTGNAGNNNITGNNGINQINGGVGIDTLTGGLGADIFIFQFGQSTISTSDHITDFAINSDKIDLLTQTGNAMSAPSSFSRAADSTVTTLDNLINQVFTDANGAITGNQGLGVNSAALVQVTTGAIAGTYLVINDSAAGFQSSNDLLINITGFTGTLPALGNIPVGNFFV